ncbi:MAG TPA: cobalamin biosynthesis protein CbiM, partial [Acidobacteria bacterium]|nr:cobalamin biosynthesis protein CbiM [Acidobacteriota bacterium]
MHVPDGFLAPRFYLPLWAAAVPAWIVALRRLRREVDERSLPRLAAATAVAFALSSIALPLPGGTSVHA